MAVNKMKKLTVMTDRQVEEEVLQALQETQVIQIKEIPETVYQMFPVEDEIESAEDLLSQKVNEDKETLLGKIMEAMLFIEREVATGKTKLKRASVTLQELEERGNLEQVAEYVQKILSLKENLQVIEQEKKQLASEEQALARWIYLDISPKQYADLAYSQTITGSLNLMNQENFLQKLKGLDKVYYEEVYTSPHHAYYFLIVMKEDWRELDRVLSEVGFTYFYYPYEKSPKEMKESFRLRGEALEEEEKRLRKELKGYVDWQESLYLAEEALRAQLVREEAKSSAVYAKDLFILQGWLPEEEEQPLTQLLTERFGKDRVYLTFEEPSNKEIKEEIPTQLSNQTIVEPFEMLTEMYSLPRYDEVDPTPLMMPFYLTFFGMMVADVGYGLLMLIGITLIRRFVVLPKDTERFMRLFQTLSIPTIN